MKIITIACWLQVVISWKVLIGMEAAALKLEDFDIFLARNSYDPLTLPPISYGKAFSKTTPPHEYPVKGTWEYQADDCATHVTPAELRLYIDLSVQPVHGQQSVEVQRLRRAIKHEERRMGGPIAEGEAYYDGKSILQPFASHTRLVVPTLPNGRQQYSYVVKEMITQNASPKEFQGYQLVWVEPLVEGAFEGFYSGKRPFRPHEHGKTGLKKDLLIYSDGKELYLPFVVQQIYTREKQEASTPFLIMAIHEQGKIVLSPYVRFYVEATKDMQLASCSFPQGVWQQQWETNCDGQRFEKWVPVKIKEPVTENENGIILAVPCYGQTFLVAFGEMDRLFFERCLRCSSLLASTRGIEEKVSNLAPNAHLIYAEMLIHAIINHIYYFGWPHLPSPVDNTKRDNKKTDFHDAFEKVLEALVTSDSLNSARNPAFKAGAKLLLGYYHEKFGSLSIAASHYHYLVIHPEKPSSTCVAAAAASLMAILFYENSGLKVEDKDYFPNTFYYESLAVIKQDVNSYAQLMMMPFFAVASAVQVPGSLAWRIYFDIAQRQKVCLAASEYALSIQKILGVYMYHMQDARFLIDDSHITVEGNYSGREGQGKRTLLGCAAERNDHLSVMTTLCDRLHADPNARDLMGFTPLHRAAASPHHVLSDADAVQNMALLIKLGADINAKIIDTGISGAHVGRTPILVALSMNKLICVMFLAQKGADLNVPVGLSYNLDQHAEAKNLFMFLRQEAGLYPQW